MRPNPGPHYSVEKLGWEADRPVERAILPSRRLAAHMHDRACVYVEVIDRADAFRALRNEWDDLATRSRGASLFNSFDWLDAWWAAFAAERKAMHVVIARDDGGRLAAALPLMRAGKRRLRSIFNFHSNRSDALIDPTGPDSLAPILEHLAQGAAAWDVLELTWVPEDSLLFRALAAGAMGRLHVHAVRTNESPYIDLRKFGIFEAYAQARFSAKQRRRDRSLLRAIEQRGGRVEVWRGEDPPHALLDTVLPIEDLGWKGRLGSSMNQDSRVRSFMHDISERAAKKGALAIVTVSIEGEARAFLIGIEHDGTFNFLKTSYDPAYAALGPGRIAVNRALEEAFARKLRFFDFLGAADAYKARYTDDLRPHSTIFVYGSGVVSELRRTVKRRIAPLARRVLRRESARPVVMDR